jgi:aldose 1-epimerase
LDKRVWKAEEYTEKDGVYVRLSIDSPDGEENYPGHFRAAVSYGLTRDNTIVILYEAKCDAPCPVNLTNHSYYNLSGEGSGDILSHELKLNCSSYLEVDDKLIPTGKLLKTAGTAYDFSEKKLIGRDFSKTDGGPGGTPGYDHCFVIDGEAGKLRPVAELGEASSGRVLRMFSTQPAVQFYTGNFLDGLRGKAGSAYPAQSGLCLETQYHPDNINKPNFPQSIVSPGHDFCEKTVIMFSW